MKWLDIRFAIASVCDGIAVTPQERAAVLQALQGPVETDDEGSVVFYVQVETTESPDVDTEECIWSADGDGILRTLKGTVLADLANDHDCLAQDLVPLVALRTPTRMQRLEALWAAESAEHRRRWQSFISRIATRARALCDGQIGD
jgi:hypothetical protein